MTLVVDTSVALAWALDDEQNDLADAALEHVSASGAWVPAIWRLEVGNVLQQRVRRKRLTEGRRNQALADLGDLPISVDPETDSRAWTDALRLAERFDLTLYDAAYLELAQRRRLPLATLDRELAEAAAGAMVAVFNLSARR